jgi:hypothetical protein
VDGFVETWYDQSGNGNDATQNVAASQPKIVDVWQSWCRGGLDFDGVNDWLQVGNWPYYIAIGHLVLSSVQADNGWVRDSNGLSDNSRTSIDGIALV